MIPHDAEPYRPPGGVGSLALAHETKNPVNAWLAQHRATRRAQIQRLQARNWAAHFTRAGLTCQTEADLDRYVKDLCLTPGYRTQDLAVAAIRGYLQTHPDAGLRYEPRHRQTVQENR